MEKGICPIDTFINTVKGKGKANIILQLKQGEKRYNELIRLLPDISDRMLSRQLKELEQDGIIHREVFPEVPPHVEYSLTDLGKKIQPILKSMYNGGKLLETQLNN